MNHDEFIDYVQENGWIKPLDELSLEELFELQSQIVTVIEEEVKKRSL